MYRISALTLLLLGAAACTNGTDPQATPSPTAPPLTAAQERLAELAQAAATSTYDATYAFSAPATKRSGTIRIFSRPPDLRVDVAQQGTRALYFSTSDGTISCTVKPRKQDCFLVAEPGEPVPSTFDPGVQKLFTDAVAALAADPAGYDVAELADRTKSGALPAAECFQVDRVVVPSPGTDATGFEDGQYCFAERGMLTSVRVQTGTLSLRAIGPVPDNGDFRPPVPPKRLPSLTPTPTPSG